MAKSLVSCFLTHGEVRMGDTQNFIHDIYCEKISRYRVYRDAGLAITVTKLKLS